MQKVKFTTDMGQNLMSEKLSVPNLLAQTGAQGVKSSCVHLSIWDIIQKNLDRPRSRHALQSQIVAYAYLASTFAAKSSQLS